MPKLNVALNQDDDHLLTAPINFSTSGANSIVAGVAAQIIRVYRIIAMVGGSTSLTFEDGTTALSGPLPFATNEAIVLTFDTKPWYITSVGNPFQINSSSAVQVSGTVYYTQGP
jgi:hypothetical protein